jgi:hypothetical protein|tara:strand:+ start:148 stop:636 length:489 start_codon:yes stop_codon:yes gene_type:complete
MPPYKIGTKAWHIENDTNEERLWATLYENWKLRTEINEALEFGSKINAIKALKLYADETFVAPKRKCTLRELKDVIDKYNYHYIVTTKIEQLRDRIEKWCLENGYKKLDNQKEVRDNTGHYIYKYNDWEYIDDAYGNMINDREWLPHKKELIKYNELWRKYG